MKQKVRLVDHINNTVLEKEVEIPNKLHLDAQLRFKAHIFRPKKGKGSYTRKIKYIKNDFV